MCFGSKTPKVSNPAQAQIAAPAKVNPLMLSNAALMGLRGQGTDASALRVKAQSLNPANGNMLTGLKINK